MTTTRQRSQWRPLEANPEVIQEYFQRLGGCRRLIFADVLSTEQWALDMLPKPVVGLLFVYPIKPVFEKKTRDLKYEAVDGSSGGPWFMKQTVPNACGTVALIHIGANLRRSHPLPEGSFLADFMDREDTDSPERRAKALEDDPNIEAAHQRAEVKGQSAVPSDTESVIEHFVAFVPYNGKVYEMDGRKKGPIVRGDIAKPEEFLPVAMEVIRRDYIAMDPAEVRFNIIAVCDTAEGVV